MSIELLTGLLAGLMWGTIIGMVFMAKVTQWTEKQ